MESLNDIIRLLIRNKTFENRSITVHLNFDALPQIYKEGEEFSLYNALTQLNVEVQDAKPKNALFKTVYNEGIQQVIISHDGNKIPENRLHYLNGYLADIADGKKEWPYFRHGNLIAGQALKEYNGRIKLENINDDEYTVRTIMEIPINVFSP